MTEEPEVLSDDACGEDPPAEESGTQGPLAELFIALTARSRGEQGKLSIGVERQRLLDALHATPDELTHLLGSLREKIGPLGLEVIEYYSERELWLALRSVHACPNELGVDAQAILGVLMGMIEGEESPETIRIPVADLRDRLVRGRYLSEYQLDSNLKVLESLGFVRRSRSGVGYGPRTLIEYTQERRENIRDQARELVF